MPFADQIKKRVARFAGAAGSSSRSFLATPGRLTYVLESTESTHSLSIAVLRYFTYTSTLSATASMSGLDYNITDGVLSDQVLKYRSLGCALSELSACISTGMLRR